LSTPKISKLTGLRIEGDPQGLQLVLDSEGQDDQTRLLLTPEMVYRLAAEIPRYANRLANNHKLSGSADPEGRRLKVDAIELSDASVNVDTQGTALVLSISDVIGTTCSWCLDAGFASKLANRLLAAVRRMNSKESSRH
jgi:hypothetical protein